MPTVLDARQMIVRSTLSRTTGAAGSEADNIFGALEAEITPPLALSASGLVVSVGAITVDNPETSLHRTIPPISNLLPTFTGATITIGATGANNATPSAGSVLALGMTASQYMRIGINLDATGNITLTKGTPGASLAAATIPATLSGLFAIGHFVVRTNGSNNVASIVPGDLYQYVGGGGTYTADGSGIEVTGTQISLELDGSSLSKSASGLRVAAGGVNLTSMVSGALPPGNGGTGSIAPNNATLGRIGDYYLNITCTANSDVTMPTAGTLATRAGTEVLTNKDHDGGTASNTSRITVPKASLSTLSGLTRKQGTVVYDTTNNRLLSDDGSNLNPLGGGAGEINCLTTGSSDSTGWSAGTSHSVATDTSNSPLSPITTTCIKIEATANGTESSTSGGYKTFTLPTGLKSKKLKVEFYVTTPASDTWRLSVYQSTTRLSLTTDSSSVTSLAANVTQKFTAYFDTNTSTDYTVSLTRTAGSGTTVAYVTSVIVGPGIQPQGAVVGPPTSYSPTVGGTTTDGTVAYNASFTAAEYTREGSNCRLNGLIVLGTVTSAPTGTLTVKLPPGLTRDLALSPATGAASFKMLGTGRYFDTPSTTFPLIFFANGAGADELVAISQSGSALPTPAIGDEIYFDITVPIAEWAGSGTVNLAQNDVQFAADDGTNDVFGPDGAAVPTITLGAGSTLRSFVFATNVNQAQDMHTLELRMNGVWVPAPAIAPPMRTAANDYYGVSATFSSSVFNIEFGNRGYTPSGGIGSNGSTWTTFERFRLRKASAGQAVGFGLADTAGNSGLVNPYSSSGAGVVYAGTYTPTLTSVANVAASTAYTARYMRVGSVVTVSGTVDIDPTTAATLTRLGISLPIASNFTGDNCAGTAVGAQTGTIPIAARIVGDTTNDRAEMNWVCGSPIANENWTYTFTYSIL